MASEKMGAGPIQQQEERLTTTLTIAVVANAVWNTANFRMGLVRALRSAGHEVICIAPDEDLWPGGHSIATIEEAGAEYVSVPMDRGGTNPLTDLVLMWRLRRIYKRVRPDVLLHYTLKPVVYGSIVARSLGVPSVAVVTGQGSALVDTRSPLARLTRALLRFSLRRSACVFFLNPADHAEFVGRKIVLAGSARILPGEGINTNYFVPTPLPRTPTFLMVARLLRDKGVYEYVEAARRIRQRHPEARFLLGGVLDSANPSGVSGDELAAWQDEGNIEYLGVTDDTRAWHAAASAVVLPSYREGMSRVLLEAISCGRPVLASDVPGCRELVDDGENGYLFPPRDSVALSNAMEQFIQLSHEEREAFGRIGRKRALSEFDDAIVNQIYMDALPSWSNGRCPRQ